MHKINDLIIMMTTIISINIELKVYIAKDNNNNYNIIIE